MRSLLAIVVTCVGLVGCNDHGAAALTAIKTKVCACKTAGCAEQEMQQVSQRTIASNHRTQVIAHDMLECFAKLEAGERPSTDPDEEAPAAQPSAQGDPAAAKPAVVTPAEPAPAANTPAGAAAAKSAAGKAPTPAAGKSAAPAAGAAPASKKH